MSKTVKVSIIGGAGYGAAEILRNLVVRKDVEILRISSKDHIGKSAGDDVVFLGMPHKITAKVAMELFPLDVKIVDLSGDFRLRSIKDYDRDYAPGHPCPERLGTFAYGLPELHREKIRVAKHVASPG